MKPAVQVKPGQKRRGTERYAVAAVKPLNSSCTEVEEPLQETVCQDGQVGSTHSVLDMTGTDAKILNHFCILHLFLYHEYILCP